MNGSAFWWSFVSEYLTLNRIKSPTLGIIPWLLLFAVLPVCLHSQRTPVEKPFMKHYQKGEFEGMPYRLMAPIVSSKQKRFPLVLSLHGGGGRGTDNIRSLVAEPEILASGKNRKQYPCYVLVPQAPRDSNWSFPNAKRPRMTEELLANYPKGLSESFYRPIPRTGQSIGACERSALWNRGNGQSHAARQETEQGAPH